MLTPADGRHHRRDHYRYQRGRGWDGNAVSGPTSGWDRSDCYPYRPGRNGKRHYLGMGKFRGRKHRLDYPQRSSSTVTTSSYTPVAADLNQYLRATATYTDPKVRTRALKQCRPTRCRRSRQPTRTRSSPPPRTARSVAENTAAGQNIGAPVAATDANSGDTLTYSIDGRVGALYYHQHLRPVADQRRPGL